MSDNTCDRPTVRANAATAAGNVWGAPIAGAAVIVIVVLFKAALDGLLELPPASAPRRVALLRLKVLAHVDMVRRAVDQSPSPSVRHRYYCRPLPRTTRIEAVPSVT